MNERTKVILMSQACNSHAQQLLGVEVEVGATEGAGAGARAGVEGVAERGTEVSPSRVEQGGHEIGRSLRYSIPCPAVLLLFLHLT